jgi:hypothetical protein
MTREEAERLLEKLTDTGLRGNEAEFNKTWDTLIAAITGPTQLEHALLQIERIIDDIEDAEDALVEIGSLIIKTLVDTGRSGAVLIDQFTRFDSRDWVAMPKVLTRAMLDAAAEENGGRIEPTPPEYELGNLISDGISEADAHEINNQLDDAARDMWAALLAAAPKPPVQAGPAWQPIETAPRDGSKVLLWREGWTVAPVARLAELHDDTGTAYGWVFDDEDLCLGVDTGALGWREDFDEGSMPTHWQHLPAALKPEDRTDG